MTTSSLPIVLSRRGVTIALIVAVAIVVFVVVCAVLIHSASRTYWFLPQYEWGCTLFTPPMMSRSAVVPQSPDYFRDKKVIVCGLLRDKEKQVDAWRSKLKRLGKQFADWAFVVVENDSKDGTRRKLLEWQAEEPGRVFVLGCGLNQATCELKWKATTDHSITSKRIQKMATLRQMYLDFIAAHDQLSGYDFTIVADLDFDGVIYYDGLWNSAHYFEQDSEIDAIAAMGWTFMPFKSVGLQLGMYQDPYAHEEEWNRGRHGNIDWDNFQALMRYRFVYGQQPRRVVSAFGGFTIYRTASLLSAKYTYEENKNGEPICEHVTMHRQLNNVYINPSMLHIIQDNGASWDA